MRVLLSLCMLLGFISLGMAQDKHNMFIVFKGDTIPYYDIIDITTVKEISNLYDTSGYFRKRIANKVFLKYQVSCSEARIRNNITLRYLQHPSFNERAVLTDSVVEKVEFVILPTNLDENMNLLQDDFGIIFFEFFPQDSVKKYLPINKSDF